MVLLHAPEIFIVEDDDDLREVLVVLLTQAGYRTSCFSEANSFLAAASGRAPDLVLLDLGLPGVSGLEALARLDARRFQAPIIVLSGERQIPVVVEAIKRGAYDFIEKPFKVGHLTDRVRGAIEQSKSPTTGAKGERARLSQFKGRELLTPRELDVLARVVGGASNKEAALALGISPRTVEVHRARVMDKLRARNTAALMRIVFGEEPLGRRHTGRGSLGAYARHAADIGGAARPDA